MKKNNFPTPLGLSESYEQYVLRCSAECKCSSYIKSLSNGGPPKRIPPSDHEEDCQKGLVYRRWKENNLFIWGLIREAVIAASKKIKTRDFDLFR